MRDFNTKIRFGIGVPNWMTACFMIVMAGKARAKTNNLTYAALLSTRLAILSI